MSYTLKNANITAKLVTLSGLTGETYRVYRNTEWQTYELQFKKENGKYESMIDWANLTDVESHIDGMIDHYTQDATKKAQAEAVQTLENSLQKMKDIQADVYRPTGFVVRHGGQIGLYIARRGALLLSPTGIFHASIFSEQGAKVWAERVKNGADEKGAVMLYGEALREEIEELERTISIIKENFAKKYQ